MIAIVDEVALVLNTAETMLLLHRLLKGIRLGATVVEIEVESRRKGRSILDVVFGTGQRIDTNKGFGVSVCNVVGSRLLFDTQASQVVARGSSFVASGVVGVLAFTSSSAISLAAGRSTSLASRLFLGGSVVGDNTVVTIIDIISSGFALAATTLLGAGGLGCGLGRGQVLHVIFLLDLTEADLQEEEVRVPIPNDRSVCRRSEGKPTLAEAAFFRLE